MKSEAPSHTKFVSTLTFAPSYLKKMMLLPSKGSCFRGIRPLIRQLNAYRMDLRSIPDTFLPIPDRAVE